MEISLEKKRTLRKTPDEKRFYDRASLKQKLERLGVWVVVVIDVVCEW